MISASSKCTVRSIGLAAIVFSVCLALSTLVHAQLVDEQAGSQWWYGEMVTSGRMFRFAVRTQPDESGKWSGTMTSLDEGGQSFSLKNVALTEKEFKFDLTATRAKYEGTRETGAEEFKGHWLQGPARIILNFRQVAGIPADQPAEIWTGDLSAGIQKLKLQMRVYRDDQGKTTAYFDSLSQQVGGFQAEWNAADGQVTAKVPAVNGNFTGKLDADGKTIAGEWNQGSAMPLVWTKVDAVVAYEKKVLRRPQHPQGDPPYRVEAVQFENEAAKVKLQGTLTYSGDPQATGKPDKKYPVAILISGSGPQDRDSTLLGHKSFWVISDHLTRAGIAVLRFDERGVGESTGNFGTATSQDFADDVACAVKFLSRHPAVDAAKIGLIGHSEGGIVAPLVAAAHPEVAWIVMLAGPGVNGEQILYSQGRLIVKAAGGSESDMLRQRILQEEVFTAMKNVPPTGSIDSQIEPTTDSMIKRLKTALVENGEIKSADEPADFESETAKTAIKAMVKANLQQMHTPWFRFFATHEPGPILEKVRCPVLVLNGQRDVQVDPELNLPKIEAALKAGGNTRFQIQELPDLNHLFQTTKTGSLSEYESLEETFAPSALKIISDWIQKQVQ